MYVIGCIEINLINTPKISENLYNSVTQKYPTAREKVKERLLFILFFFFAILDAIFLCYKNIREEHSEIGNTGKTFEPNHILSS